MYLGKNLCNGIILKVHQGFSINQIKLVNDKLFVYQTGNNVILRNLFDKKTQIITF